MKMEFSFSGLINLIPGGTVLKQIVAAIPGIVNAIGDMYTALKNCDIGAFFGALGNDAMSAVEAVTPVAKKFADAAMKTVAGINLARCLNEKKFLEAMEYLAELVDSKISKIFSKILKYVRMALPFIQMFFDGEVHPRRIFEGFKAQIPMELKKYSDKDFGNC
jgi:hypothetical protein